MCIFSLLTPWDALRIKTVFNANAATPQTLEPPMLRIKTLAALAELMGLTPADAIALPTVITVAAGKVRMSEPAFIAEAIENAPLRAYIADICKTAAKAA